jgi:hypothetical protein
MQSTGPEGYGYQYDALYCYAGVKFDHEECEDERRDPNNRTQRNANFVIGAGGGSGPKDDWRISDQFTTTSKPPSDTPAVGYDANHVYTVAFYPPADGPIRGAGSFALNPCPTCQNTTTGTFTVKVFGPAAAAPSPSGSPAPADKPCVTAAQLAFASKVCAGAVGDIFSKPAPKPGEPTEVGIQISPEVQQLFLDAGIENAATQQLIASLIVKARIKHLQDQVDGCLLFGTFTGDDKFELTGEPNKLEALTVACVNLVAREAERAAKSGGARAAAAGRCSVYFYPVYKRGHVPSKKRRRAIGRAAQKALNGSCASEGGKFTLAVKSRRKSVPLAKLLGRKLGASIVRVAPKSTPTPANAQLRFRWRKP